MYDWLRRSLWDVVPRDQRDTAAALRRRQVVTVAVVLVGAGVLGYSLRIEPGSPTFYVSTMVLAGVWVVGAFASGRLHLGRITARRGRPCARWSRRSPSGWCWSAVFVVGSLVVRQIRPLADYVSSVLEYADQGSVRSCSSVITLINGIAEELFFRGAAYAAIPRHPVAWTTLAYFVATLATGNVMLAFAADPPRPRLRPPAPRQRRGARADHHARHLVAVDAARAAAALRLTPQLLGRRALRERAAYGLLVGQRLARHDVADRGVGDDHLGRHRVDEVAARRRRRRR